MKESNSGRHGGGARPVGIFIRQRREMLKLSQKALGQLFSPVVTTQFISNVERGVTPLPPCHVPTLAKALHISEKELLAILSHEYSIKLSDRVLKDPTQSHAHYKILAITPLDYPFMKKLYEAYQLAPETLKEEFSHVCKKIFKVQP